MNQILKKITKLIDSEEDEIKCAAIRVLGALGIADRTVVKLLGERIAKDPEPIKLAILDTFIRNPQPQALNYLLPLLKVDGALRRKAIHAIGAIGPKAIAFLEKEFKAASLQEKKLFVDIFSAIHSRATVDFLVDSLVGADIELLKYVCFALRTQIEKMSRLDKLYLLKKIVRYLNLETVKKNDEMTTSGLLLLGFIGEIQAKNVILKYLDRKKSFYIRKNALYALSRLNLRGSGHEAVVERIFPLLNDTDYANVVRNALSILEVVSLPRRFYKDIPKLLETTNHPPVKRFALKALADAGTKQTVKLLIAHLDANDPMVRDAAAESLGKFRMAVPELLAKIENLEDLERVEKISFILKNHKDFFKKEKCRGLYRKFEKTILNNERKARAYSILLKQVNPDFFYAEVLKNAKQLKKRKKWEPARKLLDHLTSGAFYTDEVRYEMASILLSLSRKDLNPQIRNQDPALQLFAVLARVNFGTVLKSLKTDRTLSPEDLYYLGFHFSEKLFEQKAFGTEVLKYIVKKFPRSKMKAAAKKKIALSGAPAQASAAKPVTV
ncbi:MAG TPA: HEAT repeat domain-containing protein [Candidatus Omnitrophota bacterium]|nr:HEAT repeat domain-containing protein [Candidatus Omnitrophota bacterium]